MAGTEQLPSEEDWERYQQSFRCGVRGRARDRQRMKKQRQTRQAAAQKRNRPRHRTTMTTSEIYRERNAQNRASQEETR